MSTRCSLTPPRARARSPPSNGSSPAASCSVPAVGDPERLGVLGGAVAFPHVGAECRELLAAVDRVVVRTEQALAQVEQELAQAEGGRVGVGGGGVAAGLLHDDPVLGVRGPRQVALGAGAALARLVG